MLGARGVSLGLGKINLSDLNQLPGERQLHAAINRKQAREAKEAKALRPRIIIKKKADAKMATNMGASTSDEPQKPSKTKFRRCQLPICRQKTTSWRQLSSMANAKKMDFYLGIEDRGAVDALRSSGFSHTAYICSHHYYVMKARKEISKKFPLPKWPFTIGPESSPIDIKTNYEADNAKHGSSAAPVLGGVPHQKEWGAPPDPHLPNRAVQVRHADRVSPVEAPKYNLHDPSQLKNLFERLLMVCRQCNLPVTFYKLSTVAPDGPQIQIYCKCHPEPGNGSHAVNTGPSSTNVSPHELLLLSPKKEVVEINVNPMQKVKEEPIDS